MRKIPTIAEYRGAGVHAFQDEARIRDVVIPEIDCVLDEMAEQPIALFMFAGSAKNCPEARLIAARLLHEMAREADAGRRRMAYSREAIEALCAGLDTMRWVDPDTYASLLDGNGGVVRPEPFRSQLSALVD
jgi:hypothetical protein